MLGGGSAPHARTHRRPSTASGVRVRSATRPGNLDPYSATRLSNVTNPPNFDDLVAAESKMTEKSAFVHRIEYRTHATKKFPAKFGCDKGEPSRFVHKIFHDEAEPGFTGEEEQTVVLPYDPTRSHKQVRIH